MSCQRALLICLAWIASECAWAESIPQDVGIALAAPLAADREAALDRLIETHEGRSELLPTLTTLLGDADLAVAGKAALVLGQMGTAAFPAIHEALASTSAQQRWGATVALYRSSADIEPFLTVLTRQLSEPDALLVRASLGALARLQSRAAAAVPMLQALLKQQGRRPALGHPRDISRHRSRRPPRNIGHRAVPARPIRAAAAGRRGRAAQDSAAGPVG